MGFFGRQMQAVLAVQKKLKEITAANNWNTTIQAVIISDVKEYESLPDDKLPAILIVGGADLEPHTNNQYTSLLTLELFVRYRLANKDISVHEDYDKLGKNIVQKVNEDIRFGTSFIDHSFWKHIDLPVQTPEGLTYQFMMSIELQYVFTSTAP